MKACFQCGASVTLDNKKLHLFTTSQLVMSSTSALTLACRGQCWYACARTANRSRNQIALRVEAIALRVEAVASRLEAIALRVEAVASRLEAISSSFPKNLGTK